jgi:hypothetical protein
VTTSGIVVHLAAGTVTGDATVATEADPQRRGRTNFDDVFDATGYYPASAINGSTTNGNFNDWRGWR